MVIKFLVWIGSLLSWSPVFHVSSDSDFGSFDGSKSDFRLSLLTLSLGKSKYYFVSLVKNDSTWNFNFYKCLDFFDVCPISSSKEIDGKVDNYENYSSEKEYDDDQLKLHIELLKEKITQSRTRISSSYTKLNSYRAIILALAAAGIYLLSEIVSVAYSSPLTIAASCFLALFFLYGLSAFLQITFALRVKAFVKSTFKELKENTTTIQLVKVFYTDFLSLNNESQITVSITKNAEKYFNRSFIVLTLAWLCVFVNKNEIVEFKPELKVIEQEYIVIDSQQKLQEKQLALFFDALTDYTGEIYIISNKSNTKANDIIEFLNSFLLEKHKLEPILLNIDAFEGDAVILKLGAK